MRSPNLGVGGRGILDQPRTQTYEVFHDKFQSWGGDSWPTSDLNLSSPPWEVPILGGGEFSRREIEFNVWFLVPSGGISNPARVPGKLCKYKTWCQGENPPLHRISTYLGYTKYGQSSRFPFLFILIFQSINIGFEKMHSAQRFIMDIIIRWWFWKALSHKKCKIFCLT